MARGPFVLRRFQAEALASVDAGRDRGRDRFWVSLPPGAGKTIVGTELIATLERPAVVFCPNTAIQAQWIATWERYGRGGADADRGLGADVTVLTYQSLAVFDHDDRDVDDALVDQLHGNGRELVAALRAAGPLTLVLDECHHLLEVWGALLAEVLAELPDAVVLGLTATPPTVLDRRQAGQVRTLFGDIAYSASIPAAVREGDLAPFAELAWLVEPTPAERHWLDDAARRFVDLTTDLLDPSFGSTPLLTWCDQRFGDLPMPWHHLERDDPDLARAGLRLVAADLLSLPAGARLREQHRQAMTADDWAVLVHDWVRSCLVRSGDPGDERVLDDLRQAMPGIGYQVTRRGVSAAASSLHRVLSRSEAKMGGAADVVATEHRVLGERLRAVVVCDHERAPATSSAALRDAPTLYGSAVQVMVALRDVAVRSVLVTGRTVAAQESTARDLVDFVAERDPSLALSLEPLADLPELVTVVGWSSRQWVPHVTAFLEQGRAHVLVGTRALLGEGWDASGVNALVDLSTAATTSAVVQTRGRALRIDPEWPEKVAITWSVVCVASDHPGGDADYRRFVRKHEGYFGVDDDGDVISGVAHVDPRFSPFAPPPSDQLEAISLDMADRSAARAEIRERWRVGEPYEDRIGHTLWVRPGEGAPVAPGEEAARSSLADRVIDPPSHRMGPAGPVPSPGSPAPRRRPWRAARACAVDAGPVAYAWVVADTMAALDLGVPRGAADVEAHIGADGQYRLRLERVDEQTAGVFVEALDELLAPIVSSRHLIARDVAPPPSWRAGWAVLAGTHRPLAREWFAVPTVFGRRKDRRAAFSVAWSRWISVNDTVPVDDPVAQAALVTWIGRSALETTTTVRTAWS